MRLLALAIVLSVAAVIVTRTVGHHTTCTTRSTSTGSSLYLPASSSTSCKTSTGLW
jgi:hypothetical protein